MATPRRGARRRKSMTTRPPRSTERQLRALQGSTACSRVRVSTISTVDDLGRQADLIDQASPQPRRRRRLGGRFRLGCRGKAARDLSELRDQFGQRGRAGRVRQCSDTVGHLGVGLAVTAGSGGPDLGHVDDHATGSVVGDPPNNAPVSVADGEFAPADQLTQQWLAGLRIGLELDHLLQRPAGDLRILAYQRREVLDRGIGEPNNRPHRVSVKSTPTSLCATRTCTMPPRRLVRFGCHSRPAARSLAARPPTRPRRTRSC
jgi:hypothetical protein